MQRQTETDLLHQVQALQLRSDSLEAQVLQTSGVSSGLVNRLLSTRMCTVKLLFVWLSVFVTGQRSVILQPRVSWATGRTYLDMNSGVPSTD